jgi:hypothetical protein
MTGEVDHDRPHSWRDQMELLCWRLAHFGIGPDMAGMTLTGLAGIYGRIAGMMVAR